MKPLVAAILAGLLVAGCAEQGQNGSDGQDTSYPIITSHKDLAGLIGKRIFVQGVAENHKYAARVAGVDVFIWDKPGWPPSIVGKEVLVRGDLEAIDDRAATQNTDGEIVQTTNSVLYVLKNATWDPVKSKN